MDDNCLIRYRPPSLIPGFPRSLPPPLPGVPKLPGRAGIFSEIEEDILLGTLLNQRRHEECAQNLMGGLDECFR